MPFLQKLWAVPASLAGAGMLCLIWNIWRTLRYSGLMDVKSRILLALKFSAGAYLAVAALLFFVILFWKRCGGSIFSFLYRHRFLIALLAWVLCIIFKINGSSVACWGDFLGKDINSRGLLLGTSRIIRSDEWATYTPMILSQQYGAGAYPYFSEILRGTTTDTFIVYGLPVMDIAVLFRPFHWGFLFLGAERGFSFYWCGRIIALAVVSFEFGMLVTKNNKLYSLLITLLFTLSPTVQWWVGVNGFVEMMVFGQLSILLLYRYMHTERFLLRLCCGLLLVLCAGGFILTFYPAWQVPMGYIILGMLIWVVVNFWKEFHFQPKKDVPLFAGCLFLLGIGMAFIFLKSSDAVGTVLNTVYPGHRVSRGGGVILEMLRYGGNVFLPLISANLPGNPCEQSAFISFAPLGLILTIYLFFKEQKRDLLLEILFVINLFLHSFMIFEYPSALAEATLLSKTMPEKIAQIVGILDILMLFRVLSLLKAQIKRPAAVALSILFACGISLVNQKFYGAYLTPVLLGGLTILFFLGSYFLLRSKEKHIKVPAALFFFLLMFFSGGLVNPVQHGFDVIYDTNLMKEVQNIVSEDPDGLWICDNLGYPMNDYFIMGGAPTIDSINTYPAMERWKALDPQGQYEEIYNRYAHIATTLIPDATRFEMDMSQTLDTFSLLLSVKDLKKLQVSYVASNRNLTGLKTESITFEPITEAEDIYIFRVNF